MRYLIFYCALLLISTFSIYGQDKLIPILSLEMEREMGNLQGQFKLVEQSYGEDVLNLVLAKAYLVKLLDNDAVIHFLTQRQPEVLVEFESIVQTVSLDK